MRWLIPAKKSIRGPLAHLLRAANGICPGPFYYATRNSCHASSFRRKCVSRRMCTWQTRDIVHSREFYLRGRGVPVHLFWFSLPFFPDTRRQENILRNITRARVTGAVWSARHANVTRSSYVTAGFQKCRSGMLGMRHFDVQELQWEPEFMTTNSLVTRSLGDGTRSRFVGERLFPETMHLSLVIYIL